MRLGKNSTSGENEVNLSTVKCIVSRFLTLDIMRFFDYVTTSPSRSARCETNKPPAMRVRIEGYTKKLQTRYNKGVQANCKAKGEKYGTKGT